MLSLCWLLLPFILFLLPPSFISRRRGEDRIIFELQKIFVIALEEENRKKNWRVREEFDIGKKLGLKKTNSVFFSKNNDNFSYHF